MENLLVGLTEQILVSLKPLASVFLPKKRRQRYRRGCTEVGRAFLIHFPKSFFQKVLIRIKIARELKFYVWMIISGSKSVKKGQKMLKKATIWSYIWFFWKNFALANLIHINSYIMIKKMWCHSTSFGVIFSHLVKLRHCFQIYSQQLSTTS